jgi:hypothetical protein
VDEAVFKTPLVPQLDHQFMFDVSDAHLMCMCRKNTREWCVLLELLVPKIVPACIVPAHIPRSAIPGFSPAQRRYALLMLQLLGQVRLNSRRWRDAEKARTLARCSRAEVGAPRRSIALMSPRNMSFTFGTNEYSTSLGSLALRAAAKLLSIIVAGLKHSSPETGQAKYLCYSRSSRSIGHDYAGAPRALSPVQLRITVTHVRYSTASVEIHVSTL